MGRLIYRVCLIVVLLAAVAGGVYYYTAVYQKEAGLQKGTFVYQETGRQPETLRQAELAKEAFVYVNTGKEADTHGSIGYALFEN